MLRLLGAIALFLCAATPARADDISAAGRGVVRIVTIAVVEDEVVGFGHGSGFAVGPNRIVTNAHVVELAARYPGNVVIGVVPSEGDRSFQGRLIAVDPNRDLALIEFSGANLPPLALYTGPVADGELLVSLGYPGNVDLATAQSSADFITPLSPVRSQGNFAGLRSLAGTQVLLHTAGIARGNSGGPLLDRCGRVIGVNSAITRADDGDSGFAFAIANAELAAFLREAGQKVQTVGGGCIGMEERLATDRQADAAEAARAEQAAERAEAARAARIVAAREEAELARENFIAIAAVLLVLGALLVGAAGLLETRGQRRWAIGLGIAGIALMLGAVLVFLLRPAFDPERAEAGVSPPAPVEQGALGPMTCTMLPDRSRVTVSATDDVQIDWGADGCMNQRTQYAEAGDGWERILVPASEQTVSVLAFNPATRTYTNSRYLLSASQMAGARRLRAEVGLKTCAPEGAPRANLATQQAAIRATLPPLPNERLVYRCTPKS
ncbi:S1C family serine protease [Sphingomonas qomolangmaensis]|uniref:Serine protease n=1 Tax=Sphingomonas qomolangmaensis TaxID=2918765 RepID=A0ABY5LAC9_9SPHN|nr:serine protease [Sphingomonas qomolangmaensis]UUL81661.1 serine protease [Sphingomonas qomolangmaensis]